MAVPNFSPEDMAQISEHGLSVEAVAGQLARFARGMKYARLERPCRVGDGIRRFQPEELARYGKSWEAAAAAGLGMKFVPASGAGTRMFEAFLRGWHEGVSLTLARELRGLHRYPFFEELRAVMERRGLSLEACLRGDDFAPVLESLLGPEGLNYAALPKALIPFHRYPDHSRTPLEEHLVEAAGYARDARGVCRLHFTVAEAHEAALRAYLRTVLPRYEAAGNRFEIGFSTQKKSSDTVAADLQNGPFRDRAGRLVFRPSGHGALLENLGALEGAVVFIKNIDNVAPDARRADTLLYKKAMAGYLVEIQETCFRYLRLLEAGCPATAVLAEIEAFLCGTLSASLPTDWPELDAAARRAWLFARLNRPLRVCGMVPNQGEPGGAPFWVEERGGGFSLQIVESVQVDPADAEQQRIFRGATHFNPVDLVCGLKDFRGRPFDLGQFADPEAGFISEKSYEGKPLKALELPGLWNGAMARWNTVFVEVPVSTFTPVKRIEDLLRPEHS